MKQREKTTLYLEAGTLDRVRQVAERRRTSSADVMRRAIEKELGLEERRIARQRARQEAVELLKEQRARPEAVAAVEDAGA